MCRDGGPKVGAEGLVPLTPQEWSALAKRGGDPVLLNREGRTILDASPIFVTVDGQNRCLDTSETIGQRKSARLALVDSLQRHAGLTLDSASGLVNSVFVQRHPDGRFATTTVLDPVMLRVAAVLLEHGETAGRLAVFATQLAADRQRQLLDLEKQIVAQESNSSSGFLSQTSSASLQKTPARIFGFPPGPSKVGAEGRTASVR